MATAKKMKIKIKLLKSSIGCTRTQKETLRCLGLRRIGHEVEVTDTPANRGQILKMQHMLEVCVSK